MEQRAGRAPESIYHRPPTAESVAHGYLGPHPFPRTKFSKLERLPRSLRFHPNPTVQKKPMQTVNVNKPVSVTARHMPVTDAIRDYCLKKIDGLHLDYPKIMGAHFILAVDKHRQRAELVLHCNNHITIEAHEVTGDLYASIDETVAKAARQMRKHKTRLMKGFRPHRQNVRYLDEQVIDMSFLELEDHSGHKNHSPVNGHATPAPAPAPVVDEGAETLAEPPAANKPKIVSTEKHPVKPMHVEEAAMQLDLWERDFIIFHNVESEKLTVLYRRSDGGLGLVEPA